MEYLLIFILQIIGIALHVGEKLLALDKKFENDSFGEVCSAFWKSDRVTVGISGVIVLLNLVAHYIIENYTDFATSIPYYAIWAFGVAFVLGYGGQRIIYKLLGKAEQTLTNKAEKLIGD